MTEFSYNEVLKLIPQTRPRKFPEPQCDPILEHCIRLRKFHDEVSHLLLLTVNLKEIYDDSEREPILRSLPPIPKLPEINKTHDKSQKNLKLEEVELSEDTVMKLISKAIARIMFVLGYTDMPSHLMQKLSKMIVHYIKSLSELLVEFMSEDGSISVDLLEAVLQQKKICGIEDLFSFYTQRIVKFHDSLYLKCKHLCEDLKNNLKKPDAPPKKNITESSIDEQCLSDVTKEDHNNEINPEKNSLSKAVLAEQLFLCKKSKGKIVRFASQTETSDTCNHKDSNAANQEKSEKNLMCSENASNIEDILTDDTVLLKHHKIDAKLISENSEVTYLLSNSQYSLDKELSSTFLDQKNVHDKNEKAIESFSDSGNLLSENMVSFECEKSNSSISSELNGFANNSRKISNKSFINKPTLSRRVVKRKYGDRENLEFLDGNNKKRPRLVKHKKLSENDVCLESMSPNLRKKLRKSEHLSSSTDYVGDKNFQELKSDIVCGENNFDNCHNPEINSNSDVISCRNGKETFNNVPETSSCSESETGQLWISIK